MGLLGGGCFDFRGAGDDDDGAGADPTIVDDDEGEEEEPPPPDEDEEAPSEEDERQGTEEGDVTIEAASQLTTVLEVVRAPQSFTAQTEEDARAEWIATIEAELEECMSLETDGLTWITITFDACGEGTPIEVDGELHGQLSVEGTFGSYTAGLADLTLGVDVNASRIDGALLLRDPVDETERKSWDGDLSITVPGLQPIEFRTDASWLTDGQCSELDLHAELSRFILPWTLDVTDFAGCAGACPDAGTVAFELAGFRVSWTYNGDDTVTVTGIGGNRWTYPLWCE